LVSDEPGDPEPEAKRGDDSNEVHRRHFLGVGVGGGVPSGGKMRIVKFVIDGSGGLSAFGDLMIRVVVMAEL
jgi:hypothetical protein